MTTTDDIVQTTFEGTDDKAYRKQIRRKHAERARSRRLRETVEPFPDGACCGRCHNWMAPDGNDVYGVCGVLVITTERLPRRTGMDKGYIVERDVGERIPDLRYESLRTRAVFGDAVDESPACTSFEERAMGVAA